MQPFTSNIRSYAPSPEVLDTLEYEELKRVQHQITLKKIALKKAHILSSIQLPIPADWIEQNCWDVQTMSKAAVRSGDFSRAKRIRLIPEQRRILNKLLTINPSTGRLPYRTIVYSAPKKSGKTALTACGVCYFAAHIEAPNQVYLMANDREQSAGRLFASAAPTLVSLGGKKEGKYEYALPNGTLVTAVTSDPEKEAGGSYGMTGWSELWAFKSERARLLFDELMPVSTRLNSIRWIETYAGFEDTSDLLLSIFLQVFKDTSETELTPGARPVPGLEDITTTDTQGNVIPACYEVPEIGLFYFNDHELRLQWQQGERGETFVKENVPLLTATNINRLVKNRWQATENKFIEAEMLAASFVNSYEVKSSVKMTFGVDAAQRNDRVALVGSYKHNERYASGYARQWNPMGKNIDLWETVGKEILRLISLGLVAKAHPKLISASDKKIMDDERLTAYDIYCDPYQMHQIIMTFRTVHRIMIFEFNQNILRLESDTFLFQQYKAENIDNLDNSDLRSHLDAAHGEMNPKDPERVRIVKGTGAHAKPIDLTVAQSMSVYKVSLRPREVKGFGIFGQGVSKGGWEKQ